MNHRRRQPEAETRIHRGHRAHVAVAAAMVHPSNPLVPRIDGPRAGGGSPRRLEQALQRSVVEHLRWRARQGTWWCHIPNGGARSKIEAKIFVGLGVRRGAPDLLIVVDGKAHFLEFKAPNGRVAAAQSECHAALLAAGAPVAVAIDIDEALAVLERWDVLRPDAAQRRTG